MKEETIRLLLARIMIWGVLLAAGVMLLGGVLYSVKHHGARPQDKVFTGEPADLRQPADIVEAIATGHDSALVQLGVLLLLLNPLVRVGFAALGYASGRDWMYTAFSGVVFVVLVVSFFI